MSVSVSRRRRATVEAVGQGHPATVQDLGDNALLVVIEKRAVVLTFWSDAGEVISVEEFVIAPVRLWSSVVKRCIHTACDVAQEVLGIEQLRAVLSVAFAYSGHRNQSSRWSDYREPKGYRTLSRALMGNLPAVLRHSRPVITR
jgi:hypothetical protein